MEGLRSWFCEIGNESYPSITYKGIYEKALSRDHQQ